MKYRPIARTRFLKHGYTIIPDVLTADPLQTARAALQEIFDSEASFARQKEWHTNVFQVAYLLPEKHRVFRSIGLNPRLLPIIQQVLGRGCNLSNVNGLTMIPGGDTQKLHMDAFESSPGTCIYINALHCLDDFTQANGSTRTVVPYSHKKVWTRETLTPDMEKQSINLTAKAGSVIAYNGALFMPGRAIRRINRGGHCIFFTTVRGRSRNGIIRARCRPM